MKKKNGFTQIFSFGNKILHVHHTRVSRRKNVNLDFSVILYFKKYFLGSESVKNDNSDHDQYYITVHHKEYINSQSCIQLCTSMYCMYSYMCFQQQVSGTVKNSTVGNGIMELLCAKFLYSFVKNCLCSEN